MTTMFQNMGSNVTFHREEPGTSCPCRTPEGFRDPAWHRDNSSAPICNEQGFLAPIVTEFPVSAAVQPPRFRGNRGSQRVNDLLGEVQADDKIGFFPCEWNSHIVNFYDWSDAGEDYIVYDGRRFTCVSADKVPDVDGNPAHHWEVGLRLLTAQRPS